jgi:hypothetical protein
VEYSAVFFLYFAVVIFRNGILGRRHSNGTVLPEDDHLRRSWADAGNTFPVLVILAIASALVVLVVFPLLAFAVVVWVLALMNSRPRRRRRKLW